MAKSNKRRKQDRAKAAHKRAEQVRRKADEELVRQVNLAMQQLFDPQRPPAEVAALVAQNLADDVYLAARAAQRRVELGVEPRDMAEASRQLLAAHPQEPPAGALAFAIVAAHAGGQEDEEHRLTAKLLDAGQAESDIAWLDVVDYVIALWHPGEAAERLEPYVAERPQDLRAHRVYARALSAAYQQRDESDGAGSGPLARFADRTSLAVTRETLEAFLARTPWGERVRGIAARHLDDAGGGDWPEEERATFTALVSETALLSAEDADSSEIPAEGLSWPTDGRPHRQTLLAAFAADPQTPADQARRARDWDEGARYGLWQMESPTADPGVWVRDLVTGTSRYAEFPPSALAGAPRWSTWLGCLLPVDGIWRWTGVGLRLSPAEADAIGEYVEAAMQLLAVSLVDGPGADIPAKPPIRFGRAEPYGVISEWEDAMEGEFADLVSQIVATVLPESAIEVLRHRAAPPRTRNADGDEMLFIEADIAVSGDVGGLLLAHPDFEPSGDDPTFPAALAGDDLASRLTWYGRSVPAAQQGSGFAVAERRARFGATAELASEREEHRWVRGILVVSDGLVRASVSSRKRLERLLRILSKFGADPSVTAETCIDPEQDMLFGSTAHLLTVGGVAGVAGVAGVGGVPGTAGVGGVAGEVGVAGTAGVGGADLVAEGWAKAWLDEPIPALQGLTPREAAASDDRMDVFRLESLLRQFEYQTDLAEAAGQAELDVAWLRVELDIEGALEAIE